MASLVRNALAVLAAGLMLFAVVAMAGGELTVAGVSFLTASFVIYVRETRT